MRSKKKPEYERLSADGLSYYRHKKDREALRGSLDFFDSSGTSLVRRIPGFPHIKRVYRLKEGIERLFGDNTFFAEEKMDGYNVRIFQHAGRLFAASRGGFICPFTTEWAEIWGKDHNLHRFFKDYPEHVLCAEVLGDNPYNWQRDPDLPPGAHVFIFEIIPPEGGFLAPLERYRIVEDYELPSVPRLGEYSLKAIQEIYKIMRELNDRGREGVVLKDERGEKRLKFVTPVTDLQDLEDALQIGFDLDSGFFFNRYLRASIFVKELGLDREEYARRIGWAFLNGCPDPEDYSESHERYRVYVQNWETWEALYKQLRTRVLIKQDSVDRVRLLGRDMFRIEFRRVYQKSSHRFRRILKGHLHQD